MELMLAHGHDGALALGLAENYEFDEIEDLLRDHLKSKHLSTGTRPKAGPNSKAWWQFWN